MQFGGEDHQMLNRALAGIAKHPNIGGYVLDRPGLRDRTIGYLSTAIDPDRQDAACSSAGRSNRPRTAAACSTCKTWAASTKTIEAAVRPSPSCCRGPTTCDREPIPASEIILGTNCGGSDGNSRRHRQPGARRRQRPDRRLRRHDASSARRPRSTAPSTCSRAGPQRRRRPRSSSSASNGGSGTRASSAPRSTTIPRPATRKAG